MRKCRNCQNVEKVYVKNIDWYFHTNWDLKKLNGFLLIYGLRKEWKWKIIVGLKFPKLLMIKVFDLRIGILDIILFCSISHIFIVFLFNCLKKNHWNKSVLSKHKQKQFKVIDCLKRKFMSKNKMENLYVLCLAFEKIHVNIDCFLILLLCSQ